MTRALLALLPVLAASCGGAPGTVSDSGAGPATDAGPSACAPGAPVPGPFEVRPLTFDGERRYQIYVPATYDWSPTPVVLNFHGFSSDGGQEEFLTVMSAKAEAEGFILVYPEGTGAPLSWNGGACCGDAAAALTDDVGFVSALIDDLATYLCVDARRIYATGMSNGGFLAHRLGCELADRIAAVAPVAGVMALPACNPSRPMPVMHFHGTDDMLVPWDGDPAAGFPSVLDSTAGWVLRDGCDPMSSITFMNGDSICETWSGCDGGAEVVLCTVTGGGHTWPGGSPVPFGYTTYDLVANDAMWDFFVAHPLP